MKYKDSQKVALLSRNYFARLGVEILIKQTHDRVNVAASVSNYIDLDRVLKTQAIELVILVECNQDMAGVNWFRYITALKKKYPRLRLCMCSAQATSLPLIKGYIDAYLCLDQSMMNWQLHINQLLASDSRPPETSKQYLDLSEIEWMILKELKEGKKMQHIAERNHLTYRKVSALKNAAIRKLGLRNKTDLLVFLTR
ncbi:LuxR C-terminal-related transcriptional regulator [Cedecea colo]|uniref:Response regulator transcription factor n=1 Tax=Cedecea colo TaxID=2552946 RepID=A0ABX0VLR4_9ENTR|nr:LuxR C-terminal-related transcriptional regulator [Cedecea colo]NIY47843.1 response regulator transcription factor [Cedecea colo]